MLTGCETISSSRSYSPSTDNVVKFQSILSRSDTKVKLGSFTESENISSLTCRLAGPIDVSPGQTKADYIKKAMQTELFMAQAYTLDADVEIVGNLNSLKFTSTPPASWEIDFTLSSNKSEGFSVHTKYPFKTSFSAYYACANVVNSFDPAVQQLLHDIVNHPQFAALVGQ